MRKAGDFHEVPIGKKNKLKSLQSSGISQVGTTAFSSYLFMYLINMSRLTKTLLLSSCILNVCFCDTVFWGLFSCSGKRDSPFFTFITSTCRDHGERKVLKYR